MASLLPTWLGGTPEPFMAEARKSEMLVIFTVSMASFTILFIYATFLPMLPDVLQKKVGVTEDFELQFWTSGLISVYATSVTVGTTIAALLSKSRGRLLFLSSLLLFFIGTLLLPLSTNVAMLVVGRILQGLAASLLRSTAMSLLLHRLGHEYVPLCLRWLTASSHAATNVGPVMGGILTDREGLWGGFTAMFVVLSIVGISRLLMIDDDENVRDRGMWGTVSGWWGGTNHQEVDAADTASVAKATAAAFGVEGADESTPLLTGEVATKTTTETTYPIAGSSSVNVTSENTAGVDATTVTTTVGGTTIASGSGQVAKIPLVLLLLKSPRVWASMLGIFFQGGVLASFDATLPLFVQKSFSFGMTGSGLALLALSAPGSAVGLPISSALNAASAVSGRWRGAIAAAGFIISAPALYFLGTIEGREESTSGVAVLCTLLGVLGFALHLIPSPLTHDLTEVVCQLESENPGAFNAAGGPKAQTEAMLHWVNHVALVAGPAVAGVTTVESGWWLMNVVMMGCAVAGALLTGVFTGGGKRSLADEHTERTEVVSVQPGEGEVGEPEQV